MRMVDVDQQPDQPPAISRLDDVSRIYRRADGRMVDALLHVSLAMCCCSCCMPHSVTRCSISSRVN
jgi:hypothetical protein